ncbi:TlpA family protein disulfide reductase [Aurantibacillus circumpalustris]|uniref:TlpA family protein disulfide reductase n=1 Tax=Aurantibacillus circumpalustris TaxID=3036359 RepID=UPI00295ADCE1|nr:thioredoxin-like domain-containing protein [Aurantibacillus circumpalustris]
MNFQSLRTQPVFFKIDNVVAQLYVQPDYTYGITIPELDKNFDYNNDTELHVNIGVIGADSTELNALIFDYQQQYNNLFLMHDNRYLGRPAMLRRADSLEKLCYSRYANIKNEYFRSYVIYSIACINASVSRGENYLINSYILNRPIQYKQYEYMQFFNACFTGYLNTIAARQKGQSLYHIINVKADYSSLLDFVRQDKFLQSDSLRELVILKNLWNFYYSNDFQPEAVENIVTQLQLQTKIKEHKAIASTMLAFFNKMQVGSAAPGFSARNKDNTVSSFSAYKGRWVYLNFFSTNNVESLKEMPKIASLKKKFGDKIVFLSICLDDSVNTYKNYLRMNPKFDWPIWFSNDKSFTKTAKENYYVTGNEAYFLINNSGYLAQSPALSPSQGIEFNLNIIFKVRQQNTKTGIR